MYPPHRLVSSETRRSSHQTEDPSDVGGTSKRTPTSLGSLVLVGRSPGFRWTQAMWGVHRNVPPDRLDFQYFETFYNHGKCDYVEKKETSCWCTPRREQNKTGPSAWAQDHCTILHSSFRLQPAWRTHKLNPAYWTGFKDLWLLQPQVTCHSTVTLTATACRPGQNRTKRNIRLSFSRCSLLKQLQTDGTAKQCSLVGHEVLTVGFTETLTYF